MTEVEKYPLHRAAFFNDTQSIVHLINNGADLRLQDPQGNTALHISTMLGHKEAITILLAHNAPVKSKNRDGWNSLMEAVSYGDRQIIAVMLRKLKAQSRESVIARKPHLLKMLSEFGDFYLELRWDFQSWLPLLTKMLPSDVCKIYKCGTSLRLDTTLVDFNERTWERGNISFIFASDPNCSKDQLLILDHEAKVFQRIRNEESEVGFDEEVDVLMSSDIISAQMSTKPITFERALSGWIFKHEKLEQVGDYNAVYYTVEGMSLITRKRREHLTTEDIKKNKAFLQNLAIGSLMAEDEFISLQHRKSLPPPRRKAATWEEYINATAGLAPSLGRTHVVKQTEKKFKAIVAMAEDFPLSVDVLLDILEIVAPFKHFDKLRCFCNMRLPPGFPVRVEIPILPTISAKITFQKFMFRNDLTSKMFKIPKSYREDANRFSDL
ncbi:ankyrin repeat domain-containing protein 13C family protein [Onchocerca flexuosa]|uniref:Ankyrin repeat domain-containing protein 13C family protein n=2 Tax=Onchocerca flexuosa TaxID=387005 RepID=A0A238C3A5_9BILA|nr:ankyrin repeat domain-containing protein 13C family protein [Onchocerca flexuosa]